MTVDARSAAEASTSPAGNAFPNAGSQADSSAFELPDMRAFPMDLDLNEPSFQDGFILNAGDWDVAEGSIFQFLDP